MALRHIALFRWTDGVTSEQVGEVVDGLSRLPSRIPELRAYTFGPDLGVSDGTYDFGVVADLADEKALTVYREHPDHQAVLAVMRPLIADRASVQIHIADPE
ncbi:stress protein [Nocardiopsis gilva YIM 90087]|uniref:Stress protein n=1 Tax=Nocardiopsis gilva YIM 90087 TaxID=1235441 RepID=A0A223S4H7_9ACTN|nr:Dabb family protein [Nocardiopsis gilva]ASU83001.1 stress protein [Nocardiopsis gilva YIM 90087]